MRTVITGSGSFVPANIIKNCNFESQIFYDEKGSLIQREQREIISKFQQITGIEERCYADIGMHSSCMAAIAGAKAIADAGIDAETINQIIVAHNFGDIKNGGAQSDMVPSLASRVKNKLGIKNPSCVAYDILFGCPGWLQALIQADAFTRCGMANTFLVIGAETLSRVIDPHDRDSMIYSDGAGAVITEARNDTDCNSGIIGAKTASFTEYEVDYICMGKSNYNDPCNHNHYLKMKGRKVYEFALTHVPALVKSCLDAYNITIKEVKKIFIHQANEKMDEAIIDRLFKLYGIDQVPADIMPMNIRWHGNSSVATIPTLFDMVSKGALKNHCLNKNDIVVFASVGAGMNINAVCYRV
ncbi:3-oxoacyl-ACP synthase III family protein [Parafilimonas sp.]|uniref:3-oxoacyl-ACP synthase III family protein n=1 Tax=Parafilimonas sp. TaxID=1969739 RepID=UPI0039E5E19B